MIFKGSGKAKRQVEARQAELGALRAEVWVAADVRGRAAAALREGDAEEALALLDPQVERWRREAIMAPHVVAEILAATQAYRALALDRLGRRPETLVACEEALRRYRGSEARSIEAQRQISILLVVRVHTFEAIRADAAGATDGAGASAGASADAVGDDEFARVLEESLEILGGLPEGSERILRWLAWNKKLIKQYLESGRTGDGLGLVHRVIAELPRLRLELQPMPSFRMAEAVAIFAGTAVTVAKAGEPELAARLADECATLLGPAPSLDMDEAQRLKYAHRLALDAIAFNGLKIGDSSFAYYAAAVAEFCAVSDLRSKDAETRLMYAECLNGLAWQLACRGESEAALPMALEAVEYHRSRVGENGAGLGDAANALDTVATIHAQLGAMDAALEAAREARVLALRRAEVADKSGDGGKAAGARRFMKIVDELITMIEQSATGGFTERGGTDGRPPATAAEGT